jgi:hypothetical protein
MSDPLCYTCEHYEYEMASESEIISPADDYRIESCECPLPFWASLILEKGYGLYGSPPEWDSSPSMYGCPAYKEKEDE